MLKQEGVKDLILLDHADPAGVFRLQAHSVICVLVREVGIPGVTVINPRLRELFGEELKNETHGRRERDVQ